MSVTSNLIFKLLSRILTSTIYRYINVWSLLVLSLICVNCPNVRFTRFCTKYYIVYEIPSSPNEERIHFAWYRSSSEFNQNCSWVGLLAFEIFEVLRVNHHDMTLEVIASLCPIFFKIFLGGIVCSFCAQNNRSTSPRQKMVARNWVNFS